MLLDDALELGRITVWEPGVQLTYRSLVDDTEVDVRFDTVEGGTRVRVTQTVLPGGERAFFFWPNVLRWLVPWCDERDGVRPPRREIARLSIALYYEDPAGAAPVAGARVPAQLMIGYPRRGRGVFLDRAPPRQRRNPPLRPRRAAAGRRAQHAHALGVVDDLDAHFAHAQAAGATIVSGIEQHGYRAYTAEDLERQHWTFVQARPTMA